MIVIIHGLKTQLCPSWLTQDLELTINKLGHMGLGRVPNNSRKSYEDSTQSHVTWVSESSHMRCHVTRLNIKGLLFTGKPNSYMRVLYEEQAELKYSILKIKSHYFERSNQLKIKALFIQNKIQNSRGLSYVFMQQPVYKDENKCCDVGFP